MADDATGRTIIERMITLSSGLGTTIRYENGIGVWRPPAAAQPTSARP
jgi:hypothetical protein